VIIIMQSFRTFVPLVILLVATTQCSPVTLAHGPAIISTDDAFLATLGVTIDSIPLPLVQRVTKPLFNARGSAELEKRVELPLIGEVGSSTFTTPFNTLKDKISPVASSIASKVGGFFSGWSSPF